MTDRGVSDEDWQGAWARPVSARLAELVAALVLLAIGAFLAWDSLNLPFGRIGAPGPGFFPFFLGLILALLALGLLVQIWLEARGSEVIYFAHRDVLIAVAAMIGVAFGFERADSYVVLGLFTAALLLFLARTAWWRVVLGSVLGMVAVWLFFGEALAVRLPVGEFWQELAAGLSALSPVGPK